MGNCGEDHEEGWKPSKKKANAGRKNGAKNGSSGLNTNPIGSQPNEGDALDPTTAKRKAQVHQPIPPLASQNPYEILGESSSGKEDMSEPALNQ